MPVEEGSEVCKKVIKMISRMGNIDNLERVNKVSLGGNKFNCWADIKEGKIHTIEDNNNIIKGIDLKNEGEKTKLVKVFIQPQFIQRYAFVTEISEVIFDLK